MMSKNNNKICFSKLVINLDFILCSLFSLFFHLSYSIKIVKKGNISLLSSSYNVFKKNLWRYHFSYDHFLQTPHLKGEWNSSLSLNYALWLQSWSALLSHCISIKKMLFINLLHFDFYSFLIKLFFDLNNEF